MFNHSMNGLLIVLQKFVLAIIYLKIRDTNFLFALNIVVVTETSVKPCSTGEIKTKFI